jgi:hypothetical protein
MGWFRVQPSDLLIFLFVLSLSGCERGCARSWLSKTQQAGEGTPVPSLVGTDCPDGLARCDEGSVRVSRLAVLPPHCQGPEGTCQCPWEVVGACSTGCVAEGVELAVERGSAVTQLCAAGDGGVLVLAAPTTGPAPSCDEGEAFRCVGGDIVACTERHVVGRCLRGCYREGASLDGDTSLPREKAYALLCSR